MIAIIGDYLNQTKQLYKSLVYKVSKLILSHSQVQVTNLESWNSIYISAA